MRFEIGTYEARNAAGRVSGVGISWCEARVWAEWLLFKAGEGAYWLTFFVLLPGIGLSLTHGASVLVPTFVVAALVFGAAHALFWLGWRVPAEARWIEFSPDGRITCSNQGPWRTTVADIANIEWEELKRTKSEDDLPYTHGVRIITTRGRVLHVARNLEPDDAAGLAVALTEACEAVTYVDRVSSGRGMPEPVW